MVEGGHKKILSDLAKRQQANKSEIAGAVQNQISKTRDEINERCDKSLEDKVRVEEIQDALKKITDSFHGKIATVQESLSVAITTKYADNCQNIVQAKELVAKVLTQLTKLNEEKDQLKEIINAKVDHSKLKSYTDELKDDLTVLQHEIKTRVTHTDVTDLLCKSGASPTELSTDMQNITKSIAKLVKEFKVHKQDCISFNEASLRDNCFGRWLWTRADLVNPGDFLAWDTESANTSPQTLRWWKPQSKEHSADGNMIVVDRGGLYEVSIAFFINSAMSQTRSKNTDPARTSQFGEAQAN